MLYLIDANVLIDAQRDYYPMDRVKEFWSWLLHQGEQGNIKITQEQLDEILDSKDTDKGKSDPLVAWCDDAATKKALLLDEAADAQLVQKVTEDGYAPDLTDIELTTVGKDPFLISAALAKADARTVVTTEVSEPKKQRANRKIPDVCKRLGVQCVHTFALVKTLNFSTDWEKKKGQ